MPGTPIQQFADFMNVTGPTIFSGPGEFLNEAVNQTYSFSRFLKGKGVDDVFAGGDQIQDFVMFDESSTFTEYNPNASFTWSQPQVTTQMSISWRFAMDQMSWTDHEILLNVDGRMTRNAAKVQYKRLKNIIKSRCWTSIANGMEQRLWRDGSGNTAEMETASGTYAYSIPALISEDTTNYHPNGWTTVQGIDPANQSKWRNQVQTYDYDDPDDTDGDADGLIDKFDAMRRLIHFIPPDFHKEAFEKAGSRYSIFCSGGGLDLMKRLLRDRNDTLIKKQDAAYPHPQFDGIDMVYVAHLDTATLDYDNDGGAATTETGATTDGYRYWWVDHDMLRSVFHTERYFYGKDPYTLPQQPWTWVQPIDIWNNLFCRSRQRLGIVAPQ